MHCRCTGRCGVDLHEGGDVSPSAARKGVFTPARSATPTVVQGSVDHGNDAGADTNKKLKNALESLPHPNDMIFGRKTAKAMPAEVPMTPMHMVHPNNPAGNGRIVDAGNGALHRLRGEVTSNRAAGRTNPAAADTGSNALQSGTTSKTSSSKVSKAGAKDTFSDTSEDDEDSKATAKRSPRHSKSHHSKASSRSESLTVDTTATTSSSKHSTSKKMQASRSMSSKVSSDEESDREQTQASTKEALFTPTPTLGTFNQPKTRRVPDEDTKARSKRSNTKQHYDEDSSSESDEADVERKEQERKTQAKAERERLRLKEEERQAAKEEKRQREHEQELQREKEARKREKEEKREKEKRKREKEEKRALAAAAVVEAKRREKEGQQKKAKQVLDEGDDSEGQSDDSSSEDQKPVVKKKASKKERANGKKSKAVAKADVNSDIEKNEDEDDEESDKAASVPPLRPEVHMKKRMMAASASIDATSLGSFEPTVYGAAGGPQHPTMLAAATVPNSTHKPESKRERIKMALAEKLAEGLEKHMARTAARQHSTPANHHSPTEMHTAQPTVTPLPPVQTQLTSTVVPSSMNAIAKLVVRHSTHQPNTLHFLDMSRFDDAGGPLIAFRLEGSSPAAAQDNATAHGGHGHRGKPLPNKDWLHDSLHNGTKLQGNLRLSVGRDGPALFDILVRRRAVDKYTIQGMPGVEHASSLAKFNDAPHWGDREDYRHLFCQSPGGHAYKWFIDDPDKLMRMLGRGEKDYGHVYVEARSTVATGGGGGHGRRRATMVKETTLIFLPGIEAGGNTKSEKTRFIENGFACATWWCARQTYDEGQMAAAHAEVEMIENIEKAFEVDLLAGA
jgi:hypothetical protein